MLAKTLSIVETDSNQAADSLNDGDNRDAGIIDFDHLQQIVPDSAEQAKVLFEFLSHIRTDFNNLLEIQKNGDQANVERTAHRMKGSSRMAGATDIAGTCTTIELAAKQGNMNEVHAAMQRLTTAIAEFETCLREFAKLQGKSDEDR
jgi:HPt (histidine-containing phosphotransfer) domain-containing protein